MRMLFLLTALFCISCSEDTMDTQRSTTVAIDQAQPKGFATQVGSVNFPASCNTEAQEMVEHGVGLVHNMTYGEANRVFTRAIETDPQCAMAYWGKGMTIIHPLWPDTPGDALLQEGWELVSLSRQQQDITEREKDYINALAAYFEDAAQKSEAERLIAFEQGWKKVYENNPDDLEAAAFYALMHLAPARFLPGDDNYTSQKESAEIVARILEQVPGHPGAHHYTIHAYDFPELAELALDVSFNYGRIAPDVPHALHMPSHIFTRLGMWQDSIEMNTRSGDVALVQSKQIQSLLNDYPHALDYLVYAYLQLGQDEHAEAIKEELFSHNIGYTPINYDASAYALAAVPARILLEQHLWNEASHLPPLQPEHFPWSAQHTPYDAITYYARAIGAARSGDIDATQVAINMLEEKRVWIKENRKNSYWDKQIDTQLLSSRAWLAYLQGDHEDALAMMQEATEIEVATEKAGVTPGEVLPAGELLGDMYMEMEKYDEAISSYRAVIEYSPNRFNTLYGIARSAELSGNHEVATEYYQKILSSTEGMTQEREQFAHAKSYLDKVAI